MSNDRTHVKVLADVGGTNARLALAAGETILPDSLRRFRGEDYSSFDAVLTTYLGDAGSPEVEAVCVAVAGPVSAGRASLTNRAWDFAEDRLGSLTGARRACLINDLTALGHATARIRPRVLRPAPEDRPRNGQSLVVGAGTGFNVCAIAALPGGGRVCLEAEEGHTALPASVAAILRERIGADAEAFATVEETFAGRGLARLHAALNGGTAIPAEAVVATADSGNAAAVASCDLFADLFGRLLRELALHFMPREGIWLAGSVARSLLPRMDLVTAAMLAEPFMRHIPAAMPLLLIEDDMAALQGCLAAITQ